jgi:hypothetical protein
LPQGRCLGYKKIIRHMKNFSHSLSLQPTVGRSEALLTFLKSHSFQSTLALASGG